VKYRVDKKANGKGWSVEPNPSGHPDGPRVVDAADLKDADGNVLPADVVQLLVRRQVLVPLAADTPPKAEATAPAKKSPKE